MAVLNAGAFFSAVTVHLFTWIDVLPLTFTLLLSLFLPILPLVVSIIAVEHRAAVTRQFGQALYAGVPTWARRVAVAFFAYFAVIFVSFLIYSRGGSLALSNGQHVVERGQHIIRGLTYTEYLGFVNWETRFFSACAMSFYAIGTLYWWFPRKDFPLQLHQV